MKSCLFLLAIVSAAPLWAFDAAQYQSHVRHVLKERCYACHGALRQEAGLRLDTVALMLKGGESGAAIVASDPQASILLKRVTSADDADRMPPEGERLKPEDVEAIRNWIQSGAAAPVGETPEVDPRSHWAFLAPKRPEVPAVQRPEWGRNPIDAFIAAGHDSQKLVPQAASEKDIWLRRVFIDLTGLPPSSTDLRNFLDDAAPDARERVVDRLLQSPQYGERWGRHWMDIWRYSDWWGLGAEVRNSQKHLWHWRDWIIESLNADTGYDQMLLEMLAADELFPNDLQKLRASGFLARQYFKFNRTSWLDDTIQHTSKAMLGLTFNCSKCHDHKYDPISQLEYYQLRAFFEPYQIRTDAIGDVLDFEQDGLPRAFDCNADAPTYVHIRGDDRNPDTSRPVTPEIPKFLAFDQFAVTPVQLPVEASDPSLRPHVVQARLKSAQHAIQTAQNSLAMAQQQLELARMAASKPAPDAPVMPPQVIVEDHFAAAQPELWNVRSGEWTWIDGSLTQSQTGSSNALLTLQKEVPENFEATFHYIPVGGEMWKSVGLRFDVVGDDNVTVYLSCYDGGPRAQVSWLQGGQQVYPPDAAQPRRIDLNSPQEVTVRVRGTLVNVLINGEFSITKRLPFKRRAGPIELMTFDAIAKFQSFRLSPLDAATMLQEDPNSSEAQGTLTVEQAQATVDLAGRSLRTAELQPPTLEAKVLAQRAMLEQPDAPETQTLVQAAALAEKQMAVAMAEESVARATLDVLKSTPEKRVEVEKKLADVQTALAKQQDLLSQPGHSFTALTGALKTLENNLESEESRRRPFPRTSTGRRTMLARWITDNRNPLTARVAVNHIWARHFGRGLVPTVFDFGRKGAAPSHPELLDWLATELMQNNWSMKHIHRLIVLSHTWQLSSSAHNADTVTLQTDPDNRWYWRANPIRMEAQVVRDSILALAGQLDLTSGGPTIPVADDSSRRRSLYYFQSHNEHQQFLSMFDDASVLECYRRADSIVPQQALALENSPMVMEMATLIAARLTESATVPSDEQFIQDAFRLVLGTAPLPAEITACTQAMHDLRNVPGESATTDAKVRTALVLALLNHNDFVTVR